mgnify:CR=1 FL=1
MGLTRMYLASRYWRFGRADGSVIAEKIRLRRDGTIEGYVHPNEARWRLEMGILYFCREDGVVSTRFGIDRLEPAPAVLSGRFLFDERITHTLTETGKVPLPMRRELPWILPVRPNLGQPLLLDPEGLVHFEITFAGTSANPPHPNDLFRMLKAPSASQPAWITLTLGQQGKSIVPLHPAEVIDIVTYSKADDHNPPRSAREHQYRAGFRWEARVRMGLDPNDVIRQGAYGWPRLFDIRWWHRGQTPQTLHHAVYVCDLRGKAGFSFLHVTDTHIAGRNDLIPEVLMETRGRCESRQLQLRYNNFNDNLRAVVRFANREKVDFIVLTGDIVDFYHDGILDYSAGVGFYQDYEAGERGERGGWLGLPPQATSNVRKFVDIITGLDGRGEALRCPVFCVLGNHDYLLMEYPVSLDGTFIGHPIAQVRKPDAWGLSDEEANEFEFWKRQKGDSLAERMKRKRPGQHFERQGCEQGRCILYGKPDFVRVNYSQYLTEISYDTDFVVPLGKHRLICLNTGEDVGIPDYDRLILHEIDPDSLPVLQRHYLDDQSHNRGILLSHYEMINEAVREAKSGGGLALLFTHAPLVRERTPGDYDSSRADWNRGSGMSGDEICLYDRSRENANSIPGMDGAVAEWDSRIPIPMVTWLQTGAGGLHAVFSGHSHDTREYRMSNGVQVCKGTYSADLSTAPNKEAWLKQHGPIQFISGALKSRTCSFRQVTVEGDALRTAGMREIPGFHREDHRSLPFFFTAKSVELARFGGYENPARNDINPAVHLNWAGAVRHTLNVLWDLMEKYELQRRNIEYLEAVLQTEGRSSMPSALLEKLQRVEAAIEDAIPRYARIIGKYPSTDWWYDPRDPGLPYGRRRNQFYALCAAGLNEFGLDFGSPEKNSLDLQVHYRWACRRSADRLQDAIEEKAGMLFEFARSGSIRLPAMWFASESIHLAPWCTWDNPARDSRDPSFHLRWALQQSRDSIMKDLCEKYELAAGYQYQTRQKSGLQEFYIYHSMRMAAWGASVGTLDEKPDPVYFEAQAARLRASVDNETEWVVALIRDIRQRVTQIGYSLETSGP